MEQQIYGYARVSSYDQNLNRQLDEFKKHQIPEDNVRTECMSGKNFDRSVYQELKKRLNPDDILVVTSIDRLGRNYEEIKEEWRDLTKVIKAHVRVLDVPLLDTTVTVNDTTATFISDFVLQILSYFAERERTVIRQRQAEGIAAARKRGVHLGRPPLKCPENFDEVYAKYKCGEISLSDALISLNMKKSSFYKFAKLRSDG